MARRVLIVDDSPTLRKVVSSLLQRHGFETVPAADGQAALEALSRPDARFDLALVDFVMPRMNGFQFCRALRADSAFRDLPVVLMSAKAEKIRERFAQQTGAVDAIAKPFDAKALLAVVEGALRQGAHVFPPFPAVSSPTADRPRYVVADPHVAAPALSGDLAAISVGGILQLLHMEGQSGVLSVFAGPREIVLALREGRIDFAQGRNLSPEFRLGRYFLEHQLLTPEELVRVLRDQEGVTLGPKTPPGESGVAPRPSAHSHRGERRPLGALLVDAGHVSHEQLREALARQSSELVYELLRWSSGRFELRREPLPALAETARLGLPVAAVVMEGFRRVDEWRLVEASLGSLDAVLQKDDLAIDALAAKRIDRPERAVLEAVNGVRTVREVVAHSHMSSFDACKILFRFLEARLVRRRAA